MRHHVFGVARESSTNMLQAMRDATEVVRLRVPCGPTCEVLDGNNLPNAPLGRAVSVNATALVMTTRAPQAIDRAIHGGPRKTRTGIGMQKPPASEATRQQGVMSRGDWI